MNKRMFAVIVLVDIAICILSWNCLMKNIYGDREWITVGVGLAGGSAVNLIFLLLRHLKRVRYRRIFALHIIFGCILGILIVVGLKTTILEILPFYIRVLASAVFLILSFFYSLSLQIITGFIENYRLYLALNYALIVFFAIRLFHAEYANTRGLYIIILSIVAIAFIVQLIPFIKEMRDG